MKKTGYFTGLALIGLSLTGCGAGSGGKKTFWLILLAVLGLIALTLGIMQARSLIRYREKMRAKGHRISNKMDPAIGIFFGAAVIFIIAFLIVALTGGSAPAEETTPPSTQTPATLPPKKVELRPSASSDPANWGIQWQVIQSGNVVENYNRENPIDFAEPEDYFALPGVCTFRSDPYRTGFGYGKASVTEKSLETVWNVETSSLSGENGAWSGSGWTGQPLIVRWDEETKQIMNLYSEKKIKSDLVEVIYATLDGHIYFLDLEDGSYTRDPMNVGMCFKGSGSLDPRGYPLIYVGAGDIDLDGQRPRMYVISLIDCSILYEYGHEETMALRQDHNRWCAFDSSPLVDAGTDTLIWPGENGLLYTIHLNTDYQKSAGTIQVNPDAPVAARYNTDRSGQEQYWYGFEASANIVDHYLYVSENSGFFYCVDLNTMELVWAQDTKDDSNSSPAFQRISEDQGYVYTAPSLHWTADENLQGSIAIYKLDAMTGQILWKTPYDVHTVDGVSGGVQSSPLLGKPGTDLDGLILYAIARTPDPSTGILVALDTDSGAEVWRMEMDHYAWSSPVAFSAEDGKTYVAVCDSAGQVFLLEGATGQVLNQISVESLVEATPAVYENMLVVGTRGQEIYGVKIN